MEEKIISTNVVAITDVGNVRTNNEDIFLIADVSTNKLLDNPCLIEYPSAKNNLLLIVSDGMGGYEGGEMASKLTAETVVAEIAKFPKQINCQSRLESAIEEANLVVRQKRKELPHLDKMGATITAVLIAQNRAYVAEVGDSRAYILREHRIKQLTKDQTMVQILVDNGIMSEQEAQTAENKNLLLQAIGSNEYIQIAVTSIELQVGDILLLCSDGLSGKVTDADIRLIVKQSSSLAIAADSLVEKAKANGGEDNITVILAKVEGDGLKTKVTNDSLSTQIRIHQKFDPAIQLKARLKRIVRPATFQDWQDSSVVDAFARKLAQHSALAALGEYGEYMVLREGDILSSQDGEDEHYWLLGGKYRIMVEGASGDQESIAFIVSPTDVRLDDAIKGNEPFMLVKRQFFINTGHTFFYNQLFNTTIQCEDNENLVIRIPKELLPKIAHILGERYIISMRYS